MGSAKVQTLNISDTSNVPAFLKVEFANEVAQALRNGAMPPPDYLIIHSDAQLTDGEKQQLIAGLKATLGK